MKGSHFRIHPDVIIEEANSPRKFNSPGLKKKKEITIAKKVYVDKDGLLLNESLKKLSANSR